MYSFHTWLYMNVIVSRRTRRWCRAVLLDWAQDFPVSYSRAKFFTDLVNSPEYHNAELFPGSELVGAPEAHGPFATRRITPDRFVALQPLQFLVRIRQVLYRTEFYPPDSQAATYVEAMFGHDWPPEARFFELCLVHDFTRFRKPGFQLDFPCAEHIVEFTEFVVVMDREQRLSLVMFGID